MKTSATRVALAFLAGALCVMATGARAQRQMENLGRGVVAVRTSDTTAYIGWRMLGTDPEDIGFDLYRSTSGGSAVQLTTNQTQTTDFVDETADLSQDNSYFVRPVVNGVEQTASASYAFPANTPIQQYISIPLEPPPDGTTPSGSYTYNANDCSAGNLDGDGEYEIVLKWDPSDSQDNSYSGFTAPVYLDAYKLNGTRLWRINLGPNIRAGAHYTQFIVYDLDGDGKAEVACKTAPGTVDGQGNYVLMPGDDPSIVYTNSSGYILSGPEYLTIFNGQTGAAMVTTNFYPDRVSVSQWGDNYGNRVDRFLAGVAYLDGQRPSLIMARGYYGPQSGYSARNEITAWNWRGGQISLLWWFKAGLGINGDTNSNYIGQGNHSLSIGDLDGDGKDEIMYGACAINHDGTGLYTTGWGHGDALHMSDMDPDRPGLEVWDIHETPNPTCGGGEFRDARTGALIFGLPSTNDYGRGCAANVTTVKGYQMWSGATNALFNCKGQSIGRRPSSDNFVVWWDTDVIRDLLDSNHIDRYGPSSDTRLLTAAECSSNNGTKSTPCLSADLFGDWREEVIWRTTDNTALHIYTTVNPATNRFYTFMHNPQYREAIAWQNTAYNQPPHPSFYVGYGMQPPPLAPVSNAKLVWCGDGIGNAWDVATTTNWLANGQVSGIWTSNTAAVFGQGDTVLFDLGGSNNVAINLVGALTPGAVTVYAPKDYVFGGSGSLGGTTRLVKTGIGALTINTTNSYTGATTVQDGRLFVNGSLDHSPVTAWGGKWGLGMIGGNGRLGGGLTVQAGGGVVPGNAPNVAGTLTISNSLTETGGALNYFDLSDDPTGTVKTNDLINVIGNLTLSGTNTIVVNLLNGPLPSDIYPLIQYSGALSGGVSNLTVSGLVRLHYLTNMPGQIALVLSSPRSPANLTWTGRAGANWDTNTSSNWWNGSSADFFYPFDNVRFDDSGSNLSVNLVGSLVPASVLVDAAVNYTFGGSGYISGSWGLTKTGSGTLTILTTNDYTGVTTINGGVLSVSRLANSGQPCAIGASDGDPAKLVFNGGTLRYTGSTGGINRGATMNAGGGTIEVTNSSSTLTIGGAVLGIGGLTKTGSGSLSLTVSNGFGGGTTLNSGTLSLGNASAAGSGSMTLAGGVLALGATIGNTLNVTAPTTLVTGGNYNNSALIGSSTLNVSVTGTYTFSAQGDWSGFGGTVALGTSSGYFRWYGGLGSSNAAFDLGTSTVSMMNRNGNVTIYLGALSGGASTILGGASSVSAPTAYVIGGNNADSTFGGRILNGGGGPGATVAITKVGNGTLTLTATNSTYSGGTTISNGTLLVNNLRGSGTGSGAVAVASGGTLGGTGVVSGAVTLAGTLSPADSNTVGTLTISNNLVMASGATLSWGLGTNSDRAVVSGNLTLNGALNITDAGGFTSGVYTLFTYGGTLTTNGSPGILAIGTNAGSGPRGQGGHQHQWLREIDCSAPARGGLWRQPDCRCRAHDGDLYRRFDRCDYESTLELRGRRHGGLCGQHQPNAHVRRRRHLHRQPHRQRSGGERYQDANQLHRDLRLLALRNQCQLRHAGREQHGSGDLSGWFLCLDGRQQQRLDSDRPPAERDQYDGERGRRVLGFAECQQQQPTDRHHDHCVADVHRDPSGRFNAANGRSICATHRHRKQYNRGERDSYRQCLRGAGRILSGRRCVAGDHNGPAVCH